MIRLKKLMVVAVAAMFLSVSGFAATAPVDQPGVDFGKKGKKKGKKKTITSDFGKKGKKKGKKKTIF